MGMQWIRLFILSFLVLKAECDSHRLEFLSTGLLAAGDRPSFEEVIVFDGVTISYCGSFTEKQEPKQSLQSKNILFQDCKSAHADIFESLHVIPPFNDSTVHVIQRRRGCIQSANGTVSGFEAWAVNGVDFLNFDPDSLKWKSQSPAATTVKHSWDNQKTRNLAFGHFIKTQCPSMIKKIKLRSVDQKTDLSIFAKPIPNTIKVSLRCHVTSTDKSVSTIYLIGDGASMATQVTVTGPLPSGDGSVILMLTAEISLSQNMNKCGCKVQTSSHNITVLWDGKTLDGRYLINYSSFWWRILTIILSTCGIVGIITGISCIIQFLLKCVKQKPSPPPSVDPQLREKVIKLLEYEGAPEMHMVVIPFIFDGNTPEQYQEIPKHWEEMRRLREKKYYDPDFHGPRFESSV